MFTPSPTSTTTRSWYSEILIFIWLLGGTFLAAFALEVFFIPNNLIDGGTVGLAMICARLFGQHLLPLFIGMFTLPFLYLAYRFIGKTFLLHMFVAFFLFESWIFIIGLFFHDWAFRGDNLEVVVIGGALLGIGIGIIIRVGACIDGTEILGIIINRKTGFTVGQVVLVSNIFIFSAMGIIFKDWHPPMLSLIAYIVVSKIMDAVIVGLDETKSVLIISKKSKAIADAIIHKLDLGLTVMYGRGGFSGTEQEILYVIVERLQLADLKELIFHEDPSAFIAIENLHEVANGNQGNLKHHQPRKQTRVEKIVSKMLGR